MSNSTDWESLLERSISAFYEGALDAGRLACDQLLCLPDLPAHARAVTRTNQVHYARPLRELVPNAGEQIIAAAQAFSGAADGVDHLTWLGGDHESPAFASLRLLMHAGAHGRGSDWIPADLGDDRYLVHLRGATVAVHCDAATGALMLAAFNDAPYVTNEMQGAARIVAIEDGLLALLHDTVTWDNGDVSHLYRFARLARSFQITDLSHPFLVDESSRAEVASLALENGSLIIAAPDYAQRPRLFTLEVGDVLALLQPVAVLAPNGLHAFPMPEGLLGALQQAPPAPPEMVAVDLADIPVLRPETVLTGMEGAALTADVQERERLIDHLRRERDAWHAKADEYAHELKALRKAERKHGKTKGKKKR